MNSKILVLFVVVVATTFISGCIESSDSQKAPVKEEIIHGELFLVEMPTPDGGTWSTRVYRFTDKKVNSTCYIIPGGGNVNTITCVKLEKN